MTNETKKASRWRKISFELREHDHQNELSKKVYSHIKYCKVTDNVTIALTVE